MPVAIKKHGTMLKKVFNSIIDNLESKYFSFTPSLNISKVLILSPSLYIISIAFLSKKKLNLDISASNNNVPL